MDTLAADGFSVVPEINVVLKGGPPLTPERARVLVTNIIQGLLGFLPKIEATREAIRIISELRRFVDAASVAMSRSDKIVLADPGCFLSPDHELGHRASRILRQIVEERGLLTDEELTAVAPEAYRLAREAMEGRDRQATMEGQDITPMLFLRLRQGLMHLDDFTQITEARIRKGLEWYLHASLFPSLASGRPSLDMAMFLSWILQDATTRGMTDERVAIFLEDAFAVLPPEWAKLAPSRAAVTRWRLEREKIAAIPHHKRPHKPK